MTLSWQKFYCCLCNFILLPSIQYFPGTAFKNKARLLSYFPKDGWQHPRNIWKDKVVLSWGAKCHWSRCWLACSAPEELHHHQTTALPCRNCQVKLHLGLALLICNRKVCLMWSLLGPCLPDIREWVAVTPLAGTQDCSGPCSGSLESSGWSRSTQGWGQHFLEQLIGNVLSTALYFYHYN